MNDLEKSADPVIFDFIRGSLWKEENTKSRGKLVLSLFMYFDDYETNNPMGSHRGIVKCNAVYLSVPCLPPQLQSKLENIFFL